MKRVEVERQAIMRALAEQRNITEAARALRVARRTVQTRMRDYGIPKGEAGRPREIIEYRGLGSGITTVAVLIGVVGLGYWVGRRGQHTISGSGHTRDLHGLDIIINH